MGALVGSLVGAEVTKLIAGKTKVDIVLVPAATILAGGLAGYLTGPWIAQGMNFLGALINTATRLHPFPMGILVSVLMGIILTLPISSAPRHSPGAQRPCRRSCHCRLLLSDDWICRPELQG